MQVALRVHRQRARLAQPFPSFWIHQLVEEHAITREQLHAPVAGIAHNNPVDKHHSGGRVELCQTAR